jgi:TldD protein
VRAISGEKTAFAYSDDISLPALKAPPAPRAPSPRRASAGTDAAGRQAAAPPCTGPTIRSTRSTTPPRSSCWNASKLRPRRGPARRRSWHIAGTWEVVLVARSDGHMAADVRPLVRVSITVIMEETAAASRVPPAAADASTTATSATTVLRDYAERPCIRRASTSRARRRPAP